MRASLCGEGACSRSAAKQSQSFWARFATQREQAPSPHIPPRHTVRTRVLNGQWLTPERGYVVCLRFNNVVNLDPSTESQDALRITDDRP
ncbi:hypothetical protein EMIT0P171_130028 [Pseudomonas sp. IT-P171]